MSKYYIDTCIWLNLFKKENDKVQYWKFAKDFLEKVMFSKDIIYYSGFVLKEIEHIIKNKDLFKEKKLFFKEEKKFIYIKAKNEDYEFARKLESNNNYKISFYDCLHIALAKRKKAVLITRDKDLIHIAEKHILTKKPEELLS